MRRTENIENVLSEILEELKNISEYVDYKKQKELWKRELAKELPEEELLLTDERAVINISKRYNHNKGK